MRQALLTHDSGIPPGVWLHGEAVAAGTVMAADLSHRLGWIDKNLYDRTRNLLAAANLPVVPPEVRRFFSADSRLT